MFLPIFKIIFQNFEMEPLMKMTGANILINFKEGIKTVFGYPGGAVIPIFDAFYQQQDVKLILPPLSKEGVRRMQWGVYRNQGCIA